MMKAEKKRFLPDMIFILLLLVCIVAAFYSFAMDNRKRLVEQNDSLIEAATLQNVERMDELIEMSQRNLEMMAQLYPTLMVDPQVDTEMLQDMIDRSYFDYVEFISPDGMDLAADGRTADLSDREYFIDGMQGNSGKCVVHNSRITNETLLIFYAPFYYDGRIVGVLSGILRGDTVKDALATDYFDMRITSYLVENNGNVIVSAGDVDESENLLNYTRKDSELDVEGSRKLEEALAKSDSTRFNYQGRSGAGSAYVTPLAGGEWSMVQYLPSTVTNQMVNGANAAGIRLEVKLILIFLAYILYLFVKNRWIKKRLVSEKQEMSGIVEAVTQLFGRFALVDLEQDTYEYLKGGAGDVAEKGRYTDLLRHMDSLYVAGDEDSEKMAARLSPERVRQRLRADVPYLQYEYQIDMDGRHWENISILCLEEKDGVPVRALYATQDVTALKAREQQIRMALRDASAAAEAANHAKSDFLARMSHDIRTPMNAIMGMTTVAQMHLDDPERLTDCLDKITISSRHLLALINDVLDMSKIESGKVTLAEGPFSIDETIESVAAIVRPQTAERNQTFTVNTDGIRHTKVRGDALRLRQVLVNLLGNAVKFTPEGGAITLTAREYDAPVASRLGYEFVCEDNGMGMDEEFIRTVFEPFARSEEAVSNKIEGVGLGMAISRNIVQMMDGEILADSTPGQGSRFTVRLLLQQADAETEKVEDSETAALEDPRDERLAGKRILLVEDNELNREIAEELLSCIGPKVEFAENGQIAVRMVEKTAPFYYDLIFMDVQMPVMNGYEATRRIRRMGRKDTDEIPIIAMTANAFVEDIRQAQEAGMDDHVAKPVEVAKLSAVLIKWLLPDE